MTSLVHDLASTAAELQQAFHRHVGMSRSRATVLAAMPTNGDISQARLRQSLELDGAAVTRLVQALERDGLVVRRLDPADNRFTLVSLTASGHAAVADLTAAHEAFLGRLLREVTDEDEQVVRHVLATLRAACSDQPVPPDLPRSHA